MLYIRNTLNHKIRNTLKLYKKKKIAIEPSPQKSQQITKVANPWILKKKQKNKKTKQNKKQKNRSEKTNPNTEQITKSKITYESEITKKS